MMFGLDPLLVDVDLTSLIIVLVKVVASFGILLVSVMLMIWFERKIHADFTNRIGPNVAGPFGLLQTLADGIKMILKEDLIPTAADRFAFKLAPFLSVVPAFVVFLVIPLGGDFTGESAGRVTWFGRETLAQVADPQIGILLVLAMSGVAVYGTMLAGWASGSKYPLLGSVRATAQMISYEAALGLALLAVLLNSKSLSTSDIVAQQSNWSWNAWTTGVVPLIVFIIALTAELNRPPFDFVEAEQELVGGFHTEYSSFRFAVFYLAEFMNVITMSGIVVTLFLGGPLGPMFGPNILQAFLPTLWFVLKLLLVLFMFTSFRSTLPRPRYDQLMNVGWKLLIPLSLGWFLMLAAFKASGEGSWNPAVVGICVLALSGIVGLALKRSSDVSRERQARGEVSH